MTNPYLAALELVKQPKLAIHLALLAIGFASAPAMASSAPHYRVRIEVTSGGIAVADRLATLEAGEPFIVNEVSSKRPNVSYSLTLVAVPGSAGEVLVRHSLTVVTGQEGSATGEVSVTEEKGVAQGSGDRVLRADRSMPPSTEQCQRSATQKLPLGKAFEAAAGSDVLALPGGSRLPGCTLTLTVTPA